MNKVFKTVIYVLIGILSLTVFIAFILSFIPEFAPSNEDILKVTDFIYLPLPLIGILVTVLFIDKKNSSGPAKKDS